ncbi:hypothetical protein D9757_012435 [Collybiopsis confluens]|uniref:Uncharacterized protein n=1 Tax=Collybiopsis confluens TaxID=2823264 RepID=A0A8H5CYN0_9AGAR|nr:hypothetical protein D9757_012435 [Collybiopsis confluens]
MFSGASPFDLINTSSNMRPTPNSPLRTPSGRFTIPFDRLPRLLNSSPDHPVLFLPVPDPSSIDLLFHWMYFGELDLIRDALHNGTIHWEGVARNVEYLGLADDIKVFLGNWYLRWIHPTLHHSQSTGAMYTEQSDTEYESDEDDDDEDDEEPSSAHDSMGSGDTLVELEDNDLNIQTCDYEAKRGRDRAVRGLSWNLQYAEKFPDASMPISRREESPIPPDCIITPS